MQKRMFVGLWALAAVGFAASLGLAWLAGSWALWGAGGELWALKLSSYSWVVFASVLVSLVIGLRALLTKSRSIWLPLIIATSAPFLMLFGNLLGS